jgi:hypothetical protein
MHNTNNTSTDDAPVLMKVKEDEFDPSMDFLEGDEFPGN